MRILTPACDAQTPVSLRNHAKKPDSTVDGEIETTTTRTPSTPMSSAVPTVVLDTDVVSDNMAARLCTSFIGHVLFLKNQVPLPIVQLARLPTSDNTTRAAKKRHELLNSFDTLASHLYTTFIVLSTALALRDTPEKAEAVQLHRGVSRAFFAVVFGPTIGSARSRIMVAIDGLETKVWGVPEDNVNDASRTPVMSEDRSALETASSTENEDEDEQSDSGESEGGSDEEYKDTSESEGVSPPLSRSPSPVPSSECDSSPSTSQLNVPERIPLSQLEDPETIRAAERLLSRTLVTAWAEDGGQGLAAEMAPTQIHILLRAPRRFDHPSWIPRQNLCTSLDGYLAEFLVDSGKTPVSCETTTKKRTKANKVQGVWIKSRGNNTQVEYFEENLAEEDELIWWSWDGKLTGFTDW